MPNVIPEPQLVRGKIFSGEPAESVRPVGLVRLRVGLEVIVVAVVLAREGHDEVMLKPLLGYIRVDFVFKSVR